MLHKKGKRKKSISKDKRKRKKEYEDLGMCGMKKMHIYMKRKDWSESLKKKWRSF